MKKKIFEKIIKESQAPSFRDFERALYKELKKNMEEYVDLGAAFEPGYRSMDVDQIIAELAGAEKRVDSREVYYVVNVKNKGLPSHKVKDIIVKKLNLPKDMRDRVGEILTNLDGVMWDTISDIVDNLSSKLNVVIYTLGRMSGYWGVSADEAIYGKYWARNLDYDAGHAFLFDLIEDTREVEELYDEFEEEYEESEVGSMEAFFETHLWDWIDDNLSTWTKGEEKAMISKLYKPMIDKLTEITKAIKERVREIDDEYWADVFLPFVEDELSE